MSVIGAPKLVLTSSSLPYPSSLQVLHNISWANANCKGIANYIYIVLPLNTLQSLIVEGVLDHVIQNKGRFCIIREDQLLLYVRREKGIEKSRVIHILEMGFTLLDRKNELMLSTPTGCAAEDIRGSIAHIALSISTRKSKCSYTNVSRLFIDQLSMIHLGLLVIIDK